MLDPHTTCRPPMEALAVHDEQPSQQDTPSEALFRAWGRLTPQERDTILPTLIHDTSWRTRLSPLLPWRPHPARSQ